MSEFCDGKLRIKFPIHKIFYLIYKSKWKQVKRRILFDKSIAAKCSGRCKSNCNATHSILHYACQFRPPLDVINALFTAYPDGAFERDCKNRLVLHIACKHVCRPEVIEYLLQKNPKAASQDDVKGRTPLILAYKSFVFESHLAWDIANDMLLKIAMMLTTAAPFVITKEDCRGFTAIEYGIEKEHRMSTLQVLQRAVSEYHHNCSSETLENMKVELIIMQNLAQNTTTRSGLNVTLVG